LVPYPQLFNKLKNIKISDNMDALVVYYSRSGNTKKAAKALSNVLECDIEEVVDATKRDGPIGYLRSGYQAIRKKNTSIKETKKDPRNYKNVIIGTPIWAGAVSSPIRTYVEQKKEHLNNVAFFCTCGRSGNESAFKELIKITGKEPLATLELEAKEIKDEKYLKKIEHFVKHFDI